MRCFRRHPLTKGPFMRTRAEVTGPAPAKQRRAGAHFPDHQGAPSGLEVGVGPLRTASFVLSSRNC